MEIIALQQYTDNKVSLYEGQIRNIQDNLANRLIEQGIVAEHDDGSSGGGESDDSKIFIVQIQPGNPPINPTATFNEMIDALTDGKILVLKYLNMPKQYGNQFNLYYCDRFYDYGRDNDEIVFKGVPEFARSDSLDSTSVSSISQTVVKCNRQNEWSQEYYLYYTT